MATTTAQGSGLERKIVPSSNPHLPLNNDGVLQLFSAEKNAGGGASFINKRADDVYFRERVAQLKKDVTALQHGEHINSHTLTVSSANQPAETESSSSRLKSNHNCECSSNRSKITPIKPSTAANYACRHQQQSLYDNDNLLRDDEADDEIIMLAGDDQMTKNVQQHGSARKQLHSHSFSDSDIVAPRKTNGKTGRTNVLADIGEQIPVSSYSADQVKHANKENFAISDVKAREDKNSHARDQDDDVFNESSSGMNILDDDADVLDGASHSKRVSTSQYGSNSRITGKQQRKMRFKTVRSQAAPTATVEMGAFVGAKNPPPCNDTQSDPGILGGKAEEDDEEENGSSSLNRQFQRTDSRSGAMQDHNEDDDADFEHVGTNYVGRRSSPPPPLNTKYFAAKHQQRSSAEKADEPIEIEQQAGTSAAAGAAGALMQQQQMPPPSTSHVPPQQNLCAKCSQQQINSNGSNEWDRQSVFSCTTAGGQSGVSVQFLQDRILEMQENHYTTNEELQAIYQELTDLQVSYEELVLEKDSLAEDKNILLESLHTQTEKLETCREQVENFTSLLCAGNSAAEPSDVRETRSLPAGSENPSENDAEFDSKSVDAVSAKPQRSDAGSLPQKSAETTNDEAAESERERRLIAIVQFMQNEKHQYEEQKRHAHERYDSLKDMLDEVQRALEEVQQQCKNKDRTLLSYKNQVRKENNRNQQQAEEIRRLMACLQREKDKSKQFIAHKDTTKLLGSLEAIVNKSEIERVNAERELNGKCAELEQKTREIAKLEDWAASLAKEKVMKEDVYRQEIGVIQQRLKTVEAERDQKVEALKRAHDEAGAAKTAERDAQRKLSEFEQRYRDECDEWEAFQQDLLVTVRVANELKSEAQEELEQNMEMLQTLQKRCGQLEQELLKFQNLQAKLDAAPALATSSSVAKTIILRNTVHAEEENAAAEPANSVGNRTEKSQHHQQPTTAARDSSANSTNTCSSSSRQRRSVRALIDTMESAIKSAKAKEQQSPAVVTTATSTATLQLTPTMLPLTPMSNGKDESDTPMMMKPAAVFFQTNNNFMPASTVYSTSSMSTSQTTDSSSSSSASPSSSNAATVTPPTVRKSTEINTELRSERSGEISERNPSGTAAAGGNSSAEVSEIGRRLKLAAAAAAVAPIFSNDNVKGDKNLPISGDKQQQQQRNSSGSNASLSLTTTTTTSTTKAPRSQSLSSTTTVASAEPVAENAIKLGGSGNNNSTSPLAKAAATAAALDAAGGTAKPQQTTRGVPLGNGPPPPLPPRRFAVLSVGEAGTEKQQLEAASKSNTSNGTALKIGVVVENANRKSENVENISTTNGIGSIIVGSNSVRQIAHHLRHHFLQNEQHTQQSNQQQQHASPPPPQLSLPTVVASSTSRSSAVTSSMATTPLSSIVLSPTHHAAAAAARARRLSNITNPLRDPLTKLTHGHGSKRNALLKWCQEKTMGYKGVDITNFSTSWSDGLALCALLASLGLPGVAYKTLNNTDTRRNFDVAFKAAAGVGIATPPKDELDLNDLMTSDWPDWRPVFKYVTAIYAKLEAGGGGGSGGGNSGGR